MVAENAIHMAYIINIELNEHQATHIFVSYRQ